jgi:hypothetical protein
VEQARYNRPDVAVVRNVVQRTGKNSFKPIQFIVEDAPRLRDDSRWTSDNFSQFNQTILGSQSRSAPEKEHNEACCQLKSSFHAPSLYRRPYSQSIAITAFCSANATTPFPVADQLCCNKTKPSPGYNRAGRLLETVWWHWRYKKQ